MNPEVKDDALPFQVRGVRVLLRRTDDAATGQIGGIQLSDTEVPDCFRCQVVQIGEKVSEENSDLMVGATVWVLARDVLDSVEILDLTYYVYEAENIFALGKES